jgi:hypothetical protein
VRRVVANQGRCLAYREWRKDWRIARRCLRIWM